MIYTLKRLNNFFFVFRHRYVFVRDDLNIRVLTYLLQWLRRRQAHLQRAQGIPISEYGVLLEIVQF